MSKNYYLKRKVCVCGCEETFHLGQAANGSRFLFHAESAWKPEDRYVLWTNRVIGWIETGGYIEDEYGLRFSYLQLLEEIAEDSNKNKRIEADHDNAGRAWMTGEFF